MNKEELQKFNKLRLEAWIEVINNHEGALVMMIGQNRNGGYICLGDDDLTPEIMAKELEAMANAIKSKNKNVN